MKLCEQFLCDLCGQQLFIAFGEMGRRCPLRVRAGQQHRHARFEQRVERDDTLKGVAAHEGNGAPRYQFGAQVREPRLDEVGELSSKLGAGANRLNHVHNNLANVNNNTQIAKSRIMDTDYANETANMTSRQMLMQAGTSMLKQSGSIGQLAMSLMPISAHSPAS